jgi:hypothetical protein
MGIVAFLVAVLLVPVLIYCAHDTSRLIWGRMQEGKRRSSVSAYRVHLAEVEAPPVRWIEGSPPWIIRVAAFTSFCLGQMVIPAVPGAIFFIVLSVARAIEGPIDPGLLGLGLAMPSAIMVALRVLGAGIGLLQRGPHAAWQARSAARWELVHNLVLGVSVLAFLAFGNTSGDEEIGCVLLLALSVAAMLHAGLLFVAANALDAYDGSSETSGSAALSA